MVSFGKGSQLESILFHVSIIYHETSQASNIFSQ